MNSNIQQPISHYQKQIDRLLQSAAHIDSDHSLLAPHISHLSKVARQLTTDTDEAGSLLRSYLLDLFLKAEIPPSGKRARDNLTHGLCRYFADRFNNSNYDNEVTRRRTAHARLFMQLYE